MIFLPNGCKASTPSVFPKNWQPISANMKLTRYIHYRFHDPSIPKPKQVLIKGMNIYSLRSERKHATSTLLNNELNLLLTQGYNPIKNSYTVLENADVSCCSPGKSKKKLKFVHKKQLFTFT